MKTKTKTKTKTKPAGFRGPTELKLRISLLAHLKICIIRDAVDTETTAVVVVDEDDPLHVIDVHPVKCEATTAFVKQDADAINNLQRQLRAEGIARWRTEFVWLHTHPHGPTPSTVDWDQLTELKHHVMLICGAGYDYSAHFKHDIPVCRTQYTVVDKLSVAVDTQVRGKIDIDADELASEVARLTSTRTPRYSGAGVTPGYGYGYSSYMPTSRHVGGTKGGVYTPTPWSQAYQAMKEHLTTLAAMAEENTNDDGTLVDPRKLGVVDMDNLLMDDDRVVTAFYTTDEGSRLIGEFATQAADLESGARAAVSSFARDWTPFSDVDPDTPPTWDDDDAELPIVPSDFQVED